MQNQPILITCQPDDSYFIWQNHLYIESCLNNGFKEEQIHILLYKPKTRQWNEKWNKLKECHPGINIFQYDDEGIQHLLSTYIPVLRPHILSRHFKAFPELEKKVIIYTDSDILWTRDPQLEHLYDDDISYMSDAHSYLNLSYFESKERDVLPEKKVEYNKRDVAKEVCDLVGITKEKFVENNLNTGGVQYILKNVTSEFWKKVEKDCISIRKHLMSVNREFFQSESKGFQSWCADLWAVQLNLWYFGKETKTVDELKFSWSTDPISKLETCSIFHNAGITANIMNDTPYFYKASYQRGNSPLNDLHFQTVLNNPETKRKMNWYYANELKKLSDKYKIEY